MRTRTFIGPPELVDGLIRHRVLCEDCNGYGVGTFGRITEECDDCGGEGSRLDEDCECSECCALRCGCGDPLSLCRDIDCMTEERALRLVRAAMREADAELDRQVALILETENA